MPHRSYASTANYRFGFNGKENDNEPKGLGNQQDYGMRVYDPRIGKFLSNDPLSTKFPWYTPYQFAGNKPIWAIDLDGMEEWYYYDAANAKWATSKLVTGPLRAENLNKVGYYTAKQVHDFVENDANVRRGEEWLRSYREANEAAVYINKVNNPIGLFLEINPGRGAIDSYNAIESGHYILGGAMAIGAFGDFNALIKSGSKGYATLATSIASKYSMEQVWSQFPLFRGMLAEAKFASNYISKGFEWMAETSPFFRKFDFYNISSGTAISLKTVNASKNFDFKNILKNIEELGEIKRTGSSVQYGREFKINEVQLDILIPKDYNKEVLNEIKKAAKNENVKVNIIRG